MKLGVFINSQHPGDTDPRRKLAEMVEQVRLIRDLGFDSLWGGEHHGVPPSHFFPLLGLLQRLSAEADGMTIGTNIVLLPLHNPVEIAEIAAFLDVITDGRFILGVGLGYRQAEFDMFQVPIGQRVSRLVEGIEVIRRLWAENNVTHRGRHWRFDDVSILPKPVQRPGPPILIGAQVDASIRRAARIADGWCMVPTNTNDRIERDMATFKGTREAEDLHPTAHLVRLFEVVCARDEATALTQASPYLLTKYESYAQWGMPDVSFNATSSPEAQLKALATNRFAIGSPEQVADAILEQHRIGITHLTMRLSWPGMAQAQILEAIERVGRDVLP
jgi:alkanesulfonate monooxygenase SsuD/methylene tetrahydromethanopterin reductase-like flavin-dependent oxidoreductase (luciferase family)